MGDMGLAVLLGDRELAGGGAMWVHLASGAKRSGVLLDTLPHAEPPTVGTVPAAKCWPC